MANRREREREDSGGLSSEDVARLSDQIAGLTATGLPLPSGIRALGEELPGRRLRGVLDRLADQLEAGLSLEDALGGQGDRFPPHLRGLVVAGARSGRLGEVLGRFAGYAQIGADLRRSLWLKLAYPLLTLVLATVIYVFVCVVLANGFAWLFSDFGLPLPLLSQFVLKFADAVGRVWKDLAAGVLGLVVLLALLRLVLRVDLRRGLGCALPLIGPVWRFSDLAEFSHLLALLVESEASLVDALPTAGSAVRNNEIVSRSKLAARAVAEGRPLAQTLIDVALYPRDFRRILEWAETHRGLPETFHMAGEMFEARARSQAAFVSTVFNTLAAVSVLLGLGVLILAVLVPMMQLLNRMAS